ncbi:ribosome-associated protein|uniref:Ribosome-associated protein n=1 Tax=Brenneria salicis ATCC 15712 = DSM 30166 TaxID=714314 RepID=A0A366I0L1_9GAMM|nr:ribosome-associated protein YbcJ [Brenneria salicis]NMN90962.1 ribosome-associated protein [Brenneria salicis ATCC 15712 = DSM 30166]RBP60506.1 ribosome-associated protein [Brenneria salicis ATCC 15712 = DSM 30166]RLM30162.1 ribosome-associated protein [Brenneria salicis ATCC 15712 = DSM 30166]
MTIFQLENHPHVKLCDLLKLLGWSESGATAKLVIAAGEVTVDRQIETRKRCKIIAGQKVEFAGEAVEVTA